MSQGARQHVVFTLAGQEYGMPIGQVREILPMVAITRVPELPSTLLGVINVRGSILPVMDVARKLRLPEVVPDEGTKILVVERSDGQLCFLADRVTEVLDLTADQAGAIPEGGDAAHHAVVGVATGPKGLIVILDPAQLLTEEEIAAIDNLIRR